MKKNPELTEQTKQNLVEAFWGLYSEKKLTQISVKEITEKAGYNRSTFYSYFNNTEEVLNYVVEGLFVKAKEIGKFHNEYMHKGYMNKVIELESSFEEERNRDFVQFYIENSKYLSVLFDKIKTPVFSKHLLNLIQPQYLEFMDKLAEEEKKELAYLIEYKICGIFAMVAKWKKCGEDIPIERLFELLSMMSMEGFAHSVEQIIGHRCNDMIKDT